MEQLAPPFPSRFGARKKIILFLCTGDTCRSPMAAGYLNKLLEDRGIADRFDIRSAGVMTVTGLRPSQEASQIMEAEGIDINRHRSSQLSPEILRRAHLILGMSPLHVQTALRNSDDSRNKTFLVKEYTRSDLKNIQIADPMGCTLEVFKKCFQEIKKSCDLLVETDFFKKVAKSRGAAERKPETEAAPAKKPAKAEKQPVRAAKPKPARKTAKTKPAKKSKVMPAKKKSPAKKKAANKKAAKKKPAKATRAKKSKAPAKKSGAKKSKSARALKQRSSTKRSRGSAKSAARSKRR